MIGAGSGARNSACGWAPARGSGGRLGAITLLAGLALLGLVARRSARFVVEGESMLPALRPGDYVLATAPPRILGAPRAGWVVVARRPDRPELELIKRVADPAGLGGALILRGDNPESSTDSRHFGPVLQDDLVGVVWLRYWPPGRVGLVR